MLSSQLGTLSSVEPITQKTPLVRNRPRTSGTKPNGSPSIKKSVAPMKQVTMKPMIMSASVPKNIHAAMVVIWLLFLVLW